jgi:hypothetical protein
MPYSGGVRGYRRILKDVADADYQGFNFRSKDKRSQSDLKRKGGLK